MRTSTMRRLKGTGTVERTRDGRFRARYPFTPGTREEVGVYASEAEAHQVLDGLASEMHQAATTGGLTLKRVVEKTFLRRRADGYASVDSDEERWQTYFSSHPLAGTPVRLIEQGDVLDAIGALRAKRTRQPLALSTRKNILNMLRAALYVAKADGLVESNVLHDARFSDPKGKGKRAARRVKQRAISWDGFEALSRASKGAPEIDVSIWTGMRQGELRALHWADVHNVEGSKCTCEDHRGDPHVFVRYGKPPVAGVDCSPKSGVERVVSLFGRGLEALRTMQRSPTGIVFPSRLKGYRAKGRLIGRKKWATWKKLAELPSLRGHDLRHTCGTWLVRGELRMGIDGPWSLEAVKEHLGHSELRTTELYADQREGSLAREMAARARGDEPEISPTGGAQALSRLRDLNSRPTVYEPGSTPAEAAGISRAAGLARAYLLAVERGDPFGHRLGVDLASAVLALEVLAAAAPAREVAS